MRAQRRITLLTSGLFGAAIAALLAFASSGPAEDDADATPAGVVSIERYPLGFSAGHLLVVTIEDGTRCAVHAAGIDCDWPPKLFFDEPTQGPHNGEASRPQPSAGGPGLPSHRLPAAGRGGDSQRAGGSGAPLITAEAREAAASSRAAAHGTQPRPATRLP